MSRNIAFLLHLLDHGDEPCVSVDDLDGPHAAILQEGQRLGFVDTEPCASPSPGCPHCGEGVPYRLGQRFLCNGCRSTVEPHWLFRWPLRRERFFSWLGAELGLRGEPRPLDGALWQLGTHAGEDGHRECFYRRPEPLSSAAGTRLGAYQNVLVLFGLAPPQDETHRIRSLSLLELLRGPEPLSVADLQPFLLRRGAVRFELHSGALWVGDACLGEVPVGSAEFFLLARLAADLDHFVPYADLKRAVLRQSGGRDATAEATLCQKLKNRIKAKHIVGIDRLLVTTNKGDGYRLRGWGEA